MPWLPFYACSQDTTQIEDFLNRSGDISMILTDGPGKWRAQRPIIWREGRTCLWHEPSGGLPLAPAAIDDSVGTIDDPWAGWDERRQGADATQPFFGPGHPGVIWLNAYARSDAHLNAVAMSSFEWTGNRYSTIGRPPADSTTRFWASLKRWIIRNSTKIPRSGPLDGEPAEIYAFPGAIAAFRAARPRDANPAPFAHVR